MVQQVCVAYTAFRSRQSLPVARCVYHRTEAPEQAMEFLCSARSSEEDAAIVEGGVPNWKES
jgi:hypothetical protein